MKTYKIVPQVEKHGKIEQEVDCKHVRFFPIEKCGMVQGFGKLKSPLFQIIIADPNGNQLTLKLNANDLLNPTFSVCHPDRMDYPTIRIGEGKKSRLIPDTLSPKITVKGHKETYNQKEFVNRVKTLAGETFANDVMFAFAMRVGKQR